MTPGAFIRAARAAAPRGRSAGLTQDELARRLGVSATYVSRREIGAQPSDSAFLARVLKACKLPPDWRPGPARRVFVSDPSGHDPDEQ